MRSIEMTNCPDCGCGVSGEYFVARVEWGVCAVPYQHNGTAIIQNLLDVVDYKKKDTAVLVLQYDANLQRFVDSSSPLGMQVKPADPNVWFTFDTITGTCIPDSVQFIHDQNLPSDYCNYAETPLSWTYDFSWPTSGTTIWSYLWGPPTCGCNGTTRLSLNPKATTVNAPSTSGDSVNFYCYISGNGAGRAQVYGWLSCTQAAFDARNYCGATVTPVPIETGPCTGMVYREGGRFFEADLFTYVKGTLTYYNV